MEILIPSDKNWKKSTVFGLISLTLFCATILGKPPTPGYAPHMFAYNMGFFFPLIMTSLGFGIAGLVNYLQIEKNKRNRYGLTYKLIPLFLLIPIGLQILFFVFNIIRLMLYI